MQLPLNATKPLPASAAEAGALLAEAERSGRLEAIRLYLSTARAVEYDLSDAARQRLVDEFVQVWGAR